MSRRNKPVHPRAEVLFYPNDYLQSTAGFLFAVICSQISASLLFALDALEQRFDVALAEALVFVALNQLEEHRRSVLYEVREYLQQIARFSLGAVFVKVDQDLQFLQSLQILFQHHARVLQLAANVAVVLRWHLLKSHAARSELRDGVYNVRGVECYVLHASPAVEVDVLLVLTLLHVLQRFNQRHFDRFVRTRHDHRAQRGLARVDRVLAQRVQREHVIVPRDPRIQFALVLITYHVIDGVQTRAGCK